MLAQSMKAVRMVGGSFGYLPDAMKLLVDRYGFIGIPTTREEMFPTDASKGITFRHGKCVLADRVIIIEYLQLFPNGLLLTAQKDTADADIALEDVLNWAISTFGFQYELIKPNTVHNSQLEVRFEKSLPQLVPLLSAVGTAITNRLDDFFEVRPQYELMTINFYFDKSKYPSLAPSVFRLDRRDGVPFDQEVYWSEASLTTQHHIEVLTEFEATCLKALEK
jgi:hypothetical protein